MVVILTSSPSGPLNVPNDEHLLDASNNFVEILKKYLKKEIKGLIIAANPDSYESNDEMASFFTDTFCHAGFVMNRFDIWDMRKSEVDVASYDLIMLSGGHVPTEHRYFESIQLREKLTTYDGLVLGVSAGSMNSADIVYCQPELSKEACDPTFQRWLHGLALTKINVLPHYQMVKDYYIDGMRLFEEVTYPDSHIRPFYCLCDGSFVVIEKEKVTIHGEAYLIENGTIRIYNTKNNIREIKNQCN